MLFQPHKSYFLFFRVRFIALLVTVSITMMDDLLFDISCTNIPLKSIFVFTACFLSPPRVLLAAHTHMALCYTPESFGESADLGALSKPGMAACLGRAWPHCEMRQTVIFMARAKAVIYWPSPVETHLLPDMWPPLCFLSSGGFHLTVGLSCLPLSFPFLLVSFLYSPCLPLFMLSPPFLLPEPPVNLGLVAFVYSVKKVLFSDNESHHSPYLPILPYLLDPSLHTHTHTCHWKKWCGWINALHNYGLEIRSYWGPLESDSLSFVFLAKMLLCKLQQEKGRSCGFWFTVENIKKGKKKHTHTPSE